MWYIIEDTTAIYNYICYKLLHYMITTCLLHKELFHTIFNILGDQCLDIYESNSGCCVQGCNVGSCYCDSDCYEIGDCCSDIEALGCNPSSE